MKKWYQSKTIIANAITAILGIVPVLDTKLLTAMGITDPARWLIIVGGFSTAMNIILRMLTNKGIDTTGTK